MLEESRERTINGELLSLDNCEIVEEWYYEGRTKKLCRSPIGTLFFYRHTCWSNEEPFTKLWIPNQDEIDRFMDMVANSIRPGDYMIRRPKS